MARYRKKSSKTRKRQLPVNHEELAEYLVKVMDQDIEDRTEWNEMRIQRYAKMRGWTEPKDFPWADASNAALTFLMTENQLTQDTMNNAILSKHPIVESRAVQESEREKQKIIDEHLDYQFFVEQNGEEKISQTIQSFVEDGMFVVYTPWVKYDESVNDLRIYPPIAPELSVAEGVTNAILITLPEDSILNLKQDDDEGFRWTVTYLDDGLERTAEVDAYHDEDLGRLELCWKKMVRAFDGPCPTPKMIEECVWPWRCENVQPPSPNNPNGADHFILLDFPALDEIRRLHDEGYYDLLSKKKLDELTDRASHDPEEQSENSGMKQLKDDLEGIHASHGVDGPEEVEGSDKLTRMHCFLGWDVNNDGLQEQIVVTMIKETKDILRVRYLTEDYPSDPPRRPLACRAFLPVPGRLCGISLLELLEPIHDRMKMNYDQGIDAATIKNVPWFFYKRSSSTPAQTIHIAPGEGVPMANPREDIFIPQFASQGDAWMMNMMALLQQEAEKSSMQGDLQFGRVPRGKASALRTSSNLQSVLAQGDARPERIMRRFFSGFTEVYAMMHELNQRFLPAAKQIMLMEPDPQGNPVYQQVDVERVSGKMRFTFTAGMFNTNKQARIEILQTMMGSLINPLFLQMGIVTPDKIYNLLADYTKVYEQPTTRYLTKPQPGPEQIQLTADEVMSMLMQGRVPTDQVVPLEGFEAHMQRIQEIMQLPELEGVSQNVMGLVNFYVAKLNQKQQEAQRQQQMLQAAQQFQQQIGGNGQPGPEAQGPMPNGGTSGNPQLQPNELLDETLPSNGRG